MKYGRGSYIQKPLKVPSWMKQEPINQGMNYADYLRNAYGRERAKSMLHHTIGAKRISL